MVMSVVHVAFTLLTDASTHRESGVLHAQPCTSAQEEDAYSLHASDVATTLSSEVTSNMV